MRNYLRMRFPQKNEEELGQFEWDVSQIIANLASCPELDLNKYTYAGGRYDMYQHQPHHHYNQHYYPRNQPHSVSRYQSSRHAAHFRAEETRRVFAVAATVRFRRHYDSVKSRHVANREYTSVSPLASASSTQMAASMIRRRVSSNGSVTSLAPAPGPAAGMTRKRARDENSSPGYWNYKAAKVTPIQTPMFG